jgi:hypothetical protein
MVYYTCLDVVKTCNVWHHISCMSMLHTEYNGVKIILNPSQVTAQQMWKQVYNTLGGNPRSTSAATCTRRHYEK